MRIAAAVAAVSIATALAVGLAAQPAQATTSSISIAGVSKTDAPVRKSMGTIKTPTVKTSGNVTVSSRSYVITKAKKTVAKTASQGKTYEVKTGTYKVKSSVKYRTYTTKKVTSPGDWNWKNISDFEDWWYLDNYTCIRVGNAKIVDEYATGTGDYALVGSYQMKCKHNSTGKIYQGTNRGFMGYLEDEEHFTPMDGAETWDERVKVMKQMLIDGIEYDAVTNKWVKPIENMHEPVRFTHEWMQGTTTRTVKVYSPYKTVTKTQTVKISQLKPPYASTTKCTMTLAEYKRVQHNMTVEQVRKIAGCKGQVDSYSVSEDSEGVKDVDLVLMFSKDNKMPIMGGITTWIQFHNGKVWVKDYCDQHRQYSKTWY